MTAASLAVQSKARFFGACPVCGAADSSPVVDFAELAFVRCAGCGLIYKSEQVPGLGVGYEDEYFRFNRAGYLKRWSHRVRKCRRQVVACLEYAPHARTLLDIGCSAGYVLEAAKREGLSPTGLDVSSFAVGLCRERGYEAVQGSLAAMPLPDGAFDVVTCKHTLEHVEDPLAALREVARVLAPGGVAFLVVPDAAYWKLALMPRTGRSFRPDRRGCSTMCTSSRRTSWTRAGGRGSSRSRAARRSSAGGWRGGSAGRGKSCASGGWRAGTAPRGRPASRGSCS